MKILFVSNTSWYLYNFRKNLIRTLQEKGHKISVIASSDSYVDKLVRMGVKHYAFPFSQRGINPFREITTCIHLFHMLKSIRPDIALTFTTKCNLYTGLCRRFLKFDQIANISGLGEAFDKKDLISNIVSFFYKLALSKSKCVFFQNNEDLQAIIKYGLLPANLCKHIPGSGVDLKTFCPISSPPNSPRRFLMFGRLVPQKGYDLFIKVAESIHLKHEHRAEFWIMGMVDKSRKSSKKLLERILSLQENGVIRYLSPSDDVVPVLHQVDVVVLPSRYNEGVPRCLLEAMACGKPIITTDWKGCRDTVEPNINGYLINVDDFRALKHYITKFINAPAEQIERMGKASRQKVEVEFDENKILNAYTEEIYT